jgi:uncharacterized protein (TIGR03437 family)
MLVGLGLCLPFLAGAQTINSGGVVNAANYDPTVAPGGIMSIFGSGLAVQTLYLQTLPYPPEMGGTSVTVNGEPAPLLFVSAGVTGVINALVPADIAPNSTATVVVTVNGSSSRPANATIGSVSPAAFTSDATGKHHVAAQHPHLNYSLVNGTSPAQPGEEIVVYVTGLGASETPVVTIGGQVAQVIFSGVTIYPGLYQINVKIPNVVAGDQEIVIRMPSENISSSEGATVPVGGPAALQPILPQFFGLHVNPQALKGVVPWPGFQFGPVRLHGDAVTWADINTSQGFYDFSRLDTLLADAAAKGKTDLIYTLVATPPWASSAATNCTSAQGNPIYCAPPNDLNTDGTGANKYWTDFVTAIANHAAGEIPGKIKYWEIWNEPNARNFWKGTNLQLIRMAKDAQIIIKRIDPQAVILSPPPANAGDPSPSGGAAWLKQYLTDGGGAYADVIAFHAYLNTQTQGQSNPEEVLQGEAVIQAAVAGKPLWNTESGWGPNGNLPDSDMQAAFLARSHLVQAGIIDRYYWYQYGNSEEGTLLDTTTTPPQLNKAGVAFGQVFNWLTGAAVIQPCASRQGTAVWTCQFKRQDRFVALAVWDTSRTCAGGVCMTSSFTPPASAVAYSDLTGKTTSIVPGSTVPIGAKPIWLTTQ